ncbi:hypothetical protein AKO1_012561 [Acrasis kona]|uniref:Cleft lip and palate associated transmembrane protein n=1 Tax=Acrasis kona TaxID=1008807 RepID=A0AAW2YW39_9EUKA
MIPRMIMMYMLFNWLFGSKTAAPVKDKTGKVIQPHMCAFGRGQQFEFNAWVTPNKTFDFQTFEVPTWKEERIIFANIDQNSRNYSTNLTKTSHQDLYNTLVTNHTLYLHAFLSQRSHLLNNSKTVHITHPLNKYVKIKKNLKKNLLSDEKNVTLIKSEPDVYGSYFNPEVSINLVDYQEAIPSGQILPHVKPHLKFPGKSLNYLPVMYVNEFWTLKEKLLLVNDTVENIPLTITFDSMSALKWQVYLQFEMSMEMQKKLGTVTGDDDQDDFKRMLTDTNPILLGVTVFVSILHSIFDFLAFKNDIAFWKDRKSMEGLSVRTIFINCFMQLVIFLYLFDNDTSWMILISSFVGLLIEFWKIKKAVNVSIDKNKFPYISFVDKGSYVNSKTRQYDQEAMRYVSYALYPLMACYTVYSLIYETHKSWYSFILGTIVGFIYMFGFIMMTPQLWINYKLKSVAHMPWKAFMYKALNTFIDDLFAFVIKMPIMHRIGCFRDDIIFFIYLYQRWKYPVDPKRMNEYGQGGEEDDEALLEKIGQLECKAETKPSEGVKEEVVNEKDVAKGEDDNDLRHRNVTKPLEE